MQRCSSDSSSSGMSNFKINESNSDMTESEVSRASNLLQVCSDRAKSPSRLSQGRAIADSALDMTSAIRLLTPVRLENHLMLEPEAERKTI
jgi:hypothetical protein